MPLNSNRDDAPVKFPAPDFLTLDNWKRGVITLTNPSKVPKDALVQADNCILVEDGNPRPRPGVAWFGNPILITAVTTNLINNPSFETDLTNWSTGTGATLTRITTDHYVGTACLQANTGPSGFGANVAVGTLTAATTIGQKYTLQARIKTTAGTQIYINPSSITGDGSVLQTATGGWDLISYTGTAIHTSGNIFIGASGNNVTYYLDAVMMQQTGTLNPYFDGASTSSGSTTYAWTGTANDSTSTQSIANVSPGPIDGFDYFDQGGAIHLVVAAGGLYFRSLDNGTTWTQCTGTYTAGNRVNMVQYNSNLYMTTGADVITLYGGTTTLSQYAVLTTPAAPTATVSTGNVGTAYTSYYKVASVNTIGFTIASPKVTVQTLKPRPNYDATTNNVTLTMPATQTGQTRFDIYYSEDDLNYYYIDSVAVVNTTYKDDGSAIIIPSTTAPVSNTTQGPLVAELSVVGNRLYGVRDANNPYRIWFSSGSYPLGSFSDAYDGGYLDWQPGGKYRPVKVEDYRDGKGTNIATVWLDSADAQGAIMQMSLGTLTVGNLTVTVPSAYKLPGSRGTPAPYSVINVLNDYHFYNSQAFYNLGNRPNLLQILSTDETSANIRPTVRTISPVAEKNICAAYFDAKVYISVPYNSTTNNATIVYDTELQAWLPTAYTIGFSQFLRYTDTAGKHHLLATKAGDNQLTEIGTLYGTTIKGDYGQPFQTTLLTGLYATEKDRYDFQFTQEMEFEFSDRQGLINVELLGIDHAKGFISIKAINMDDTATTTTSAGGWGSFGWDTTPWDNTSVVPTVTSEVSSKRYAVVNKELNAVQWHISTNTIDAYFILRSLQTWGTDTQDAHPSKWRLSSTN